MANFALVCVLLLYAVAVFADGTQPVPGDSDHAVADQHPKDFFNNNYESWGLLVPSRLKRGVGSNNFGIGRGTGANNFGKGGGEQSKKGVFTSYNNDKNGNDQGKRAQGRRRRRGTASNNFGNSWGPGANNFERGGGGPGYNGGYNEQQGGQSGQTHVYRYKRGIASNDFGKRWGPGANNFGLNGGGLIYNGGYKNIDRNANFQGQGQRPGHYRLKRGTASNNFGNSWGPGANNFGQGGGGPGYNGGYNNNYDDKHDQAQGQGHGSGHY